MAQQGAPDLCTHTVCRQELKINKHGIVYAHGRPLGVEQKAQVLTCYASLLEELNGQFVSVLALSKTAKLLWPVARRLIDEYHGGPLINSTSNGKKEHAWLKNWFNAQSRMFLVMVAF